MWINWLNPLTLSPSNLHILQRIMQESFEMRFCAAMAFLYPSYRIGSHNYHLDFWGHSKKGYVLWWSWWSLFIPKMMVKWSVRYKPLKIFFEHALLILNWFGIGIYLFWSLPTPTIFIHPFPWVPMKPCIVGGCGILLDGLRWLIHNITVLSWFIILFKRFIS